MLWASLCFTDITESFTFKILLSALQHSSTWVHRDASLWPLSETDSSSQPEPKHQHNPPDLKALGLKPRQWPISCVYFPRVTSTCVANALSAGRRGKLVRRGTAVLRHWYAAGVRNEQLPGLRDSTSSAVTNTLLCSSTASLSIRAINENTSAGEFS